MMKTTDTLALITSSQSSSSTVPNVRQDVTVAGPQPAPARTEERQAIRAPWFELPDCILEQITDTSGPRLFARYRNGRQEPYAHEGTEYAPLSRNDLASSGVTLPSCPEPYGSVEDLDREISDHVRKHARLPDDIEPIIPLYVRATWLYDRSRNFPYLRLSGPSGSGKSRAARAIGHLCYKPYFTNSCGSPAAMYRNMHQLGRHTMVLDENEQDDRSDMQHETTKILKVAFEHDGVVERCVEVIEGGAKSQIVRRFRVFGPKIVAAIEHVRDLPLRSRCIAVPMLAARDVPIELPPEYESEVTALQNKLLQYRFDHYFEPLRDPTRLDVNPRLLQLYWPLAKVATAQQLQALDALVLEMQEDLNDEGLSAVREMVFQAIQTLLQRAPTEAVSLENIVREAKFPGKDATVKKQAVGYIIRGVGLRTERPPSGRGSRYIDASAQEIMDAFKRAGFGNLCAGQIEVGAEATH